MASIRKRKDVYYVRWMGPDGKQHEKKSGRDHATAKALARKLEGETAEERAGVLVKPKWSDIDEAVSSMLTELEAKDRVAKHRDQARLYLDRIVTLGGIGSIDELDKTHVLRAMQKLKEMGLSARTRNSHLQFARSLGLHIGRPLTDLRGYRANEEADRRLVRRALSADEVKILLASLDREGGRMRIRMTSRDRRMLYATALGTGLRKRELGHLVPGDFRLDQSPPCVVCSAKYTKNHREAVQPLASGLTEELRAYLSGRPLGRPVWDVSESQQTADAVRADMKDAGLDPTGADLHAMRHTYVTTLALGKTPPAILQRLARHSRIDLTLKVYTHVDLADAWKHVQASL